MNDDLASRLLGLLEQIDGRLSKLEGNGGSKPERFTPDNAATILHKKAYTVREWCRLKRIASEKDEYTGRVWIPASEVKRIKMGAV